MKKCLFISLIIYMIVSIFAQEDAGGTDAPAGKYPYQAGLLYHSKLVCGASIISKYWLLTAAHCIKKDESVEDATVLVGTIDLGSENRTELKVKELIPHERYNVSFEHAHDVGLIRVIEEMVFNDFIQPIKLDVERYTNYEGQKVLLAGWGILDPDDTTPSTALQHMMLQVIPIEKCANMWHNERNRTIYQTHICTVGKNATHMVTAGDSGGPLVTLNNHVQIAIVSFGWENLPDVFTRVNFYVRWIRHHMSKSEGN